MKPHNTATPGYRITSTNGVISVPMTTDEKCFVLGYVKLPRLRDRTLMDELHRQRLTSDPKVAKQWADDTEQWLVEQHG